MKKATFMEKLRLILDEAANHNLVHWTEVGKTFIVLNVDEFSTHILPMYFKHSNFSSFVRQLHGYGFHKKQLSLGVVEFFYSEKLNESELINVQRRYNTTSSRAVTDSEVSTKFEEDWKSEMLELKEQYENLMNDNRALAEANLKLKEQLALLSSSNPNTPILDDQYETISNKMDGVNEFSVDDFLVQDDQVSYSYLPVDKKPDFALWANPLEMDISDDMHHFSGSSLHGFDPFNYSSFNGRSSNFVESFSDFF
jgi:hypothetical protein